MLLILIPQLTVTMIWYILSGRIRNTLPVSLCGLGKTGNLREVTVTCLKSNVYCYSEQRLYDGSVSSR